MPTSTLKVAMACGGCEAAVRRVLEATPGVTAVATSLADQRVTVEADSTVSLTDLVALVTKAGKQAEPWPAE